MRVGVITLIPGMVLLYSACAGDFNPDLELGDSSDGGTLDETGSSPIDDDDSATSAHEDSSEDSGQGTSMTSSPGSSDGSSDDGEEGSSDGSSDSSGEDTTPVEPGCGNGEIDGDEECDGASLGGQTCEGVLGSGSGQLGCFENCTYDVSTCSLDSGQPADGLWSQCSDYPDCETDPPDGIIWYCENELCSFDCETAVSECRDLGNDLNRCYLNCEGGKSCPSGMTCSGNYCRSI
jgi:hypothetical protein